MFPAPTIDSREYTFGDTVGAAGCSKSRESAQRKVLRARTRRNRAYMFYYFSLAYLPRRRALGENSWVHNSRVPRGVRTKVRKRDSRLSHGMQMIIVYAGDTMFPVLQFSTFIFSRKFQEIWSTVLPDNEYVFPKAPQCNGEFWNEKPAYIRCVELCWNFVIQQKRRKIIFSLLLRL